MTWVTKDVDGSSFPSSSFAVKHAKIEQMQLSCLVDRKGKKLTRQNDDDLLIKVQ